MSGSKDFQLNFGDVKGRWGPTTGQGASAASQPPAPAQASDDFDLLGSATNQSAAPSGNSGFNFGGTSSGMRGGTQQGGGGWGPGAVQQNAGMMASGNMGAMGQQGGGNPNQITTFGMQGGAPGRAPSYFPQHGMQMGGFQQGGQQPQQGFGAGGADPFASQGQSSMQSSAASSPARRVATGRTLADGASFGSSATSKSATPSSMASTNRLAGLATGDLSAFDIHAGGETRKLAAKTADAKRSSVPVDTRSRGAAMAFGGVSPAASSASGAAHGVTAAHKAHLDTSLSDLLPGNFKRGGGSNFMGGGSAPASTKSGVRSVRAGASMAELAKTSAAKNVGAAPVMAPPGGAGFGGQGPPQGFGAGGLQGQIQQQPQGPTGFGFGAAPQQAPSGFSFN